MSGSGSASPYRVAPEKEPKTHWLTVNWRGVLAGAALALTVLGPVSWGLVSCATAPRPCVEQVFNMEYMKWFDCGEGTKAEVMDDKWVKCTCPSKE